MGGGRSASTGCELLSQSLAISDHTFSSDVPSGVGVLTLRTMQWYVTSSDMVNTHPLTHLHAEHRVLCEICDCFGILESTSVQQISAEQAVGTSMGLRHVHARRIVLNY